MVALWSAQDRFAPSSDCDSMRGLTQGGRKFGSRILDGGRETNERWSGGPGAGPDLFCGSAVLIRGECSRAATTESYAIAGERADGPRQLAHRLIVFRCPEGPTPSPPRPRRATIPVATRAGDWAAAFGKDVVESYAGDSHGSREQGGSRVGRG